jgi:ATP/maltotriose-dependent transcriptional regulator MalT
MALFYAARIDEIRTVLPLCLDAARRSEDPWAVAIASVIRGEVAHHDGQPDVAEAAFNEAIDGFQLVGDEFSLTICVAEAAEIAEMRGEYDRAAEMLVRSISTSEQVGFSAHPIAMRTRLANVEVLRGNLDLAERMHHDVVDDLVGESQAWIRAMSYSGLAVIARRTGRPDEAEQWLERAWALRRTVDVPTLRALVLVSRGYTADLRGDRAAALRFQLDGLAAVREHLMPRNLANSFEGLAGALALGDDSDDHVLAAQLLGAADALRRGAGGPMPVPERFDVDRAERRCRDRLGDDAFQQAFDQGAGGSADALIRRVELLG